MKKDHRETLTMELRVKSAVACLFWLQMIGVSLLNRAAFAQENPCKGTNTIFLPQDGRCLVPIKNAKDWVSAQSECERGGGDLYRLSSDYRLAHAANTELDECLRAMPTSDSLGNDFWIGAVSRWSQHWFWINETLLNPIQYVTQNITALASSKFEVCSTYLSVDYCVSVCRDDAAVYTVLHHRTAYYCCFCSWYLDVKLVQTATQSYFLPDRTSLYIAPAREGNHIVLASSETFSDTETLCAIVDSNTHTTRKLQSQTCFSESRFLCSLRNNSDCENPECNGQRCKFRVRDECVQSDGRLLTWFRARAECMAVGGDVWSMGNLDDMYQVAQHIVKDTPYWIGATDHFWYFGAESDVFRTPKPDYEQWRCGHMFLERSGNTGQPLRWKWADTRCDQQKSYICEYEEVAFTAEQRTNKVLCPWEIPIISTTGASSETSRGPTLTPTSRTPTVTYNGTVYKEASVGVDSSFPIVPIIAACIAALTILLCALFILGYSRRKRWLLEKWRKKRYMWPFWASRSPTTILAHDLTSDRGFDSLSTGHTGVHGSDSGSVFAAAAFVYPDAYKTRNHAYRSASDIRDGSRRNESFEKGLGGGRALRSSVNSAGSRHTGMSGFPRSPGSAGGFGLGVLGGEGGAGPVGGGLTDEQLMAATYSSMSPRSREYMTLSAHMNIHDEQYSPHSSLRKKPEVALVTPDVDLNFTVNHAYARLSGPPNSERSSERSVEEMNYPQGSTIQIPTHMVDESTVFY